MIEVDPLEGKDGKMVMPGDEIAHAEEFAPGLYTYDDKGTVRAATMGTARLDLNERVAFVEPVNPIVSLKEGDTIIGMVKDTRKAMAIVEVVKVVGRDRDLGQTIDGVLHVSKVSHDYIEDIKQEVQPLDIIRAKVIKAGPQVHLSTEDEDMGILKSRCLECGTELRLRSGKLQCERCETSTRRKTALDYGSGSEVPEDFML